MLSFQKNKKTMRRPKKVARVAGKPFKKKAVSTGGALAP
jgi:hypothetical protein